MIVGNNVGFFGPFEHLWRGLGDDGTYWTGCSAGELVLALESDGTVKGCPSLPTRDYAGGNVRRLPLDAIWRNSPRIDFTRGSSVQTLWGYCRTCYYADVCGGGCTWMAHSLFGRPGNNPYCHYRVLELEKQGFRERIRKIEHAVPEPFAVAKFELVFEAVDGTGIRSESRQQLINIGPPPQPAIVGDRGSPKLRLCRNCNSYVRLEDDNPALWREHR
jgi:radical SAM protein with 4Fe4S-binding SPASM domain